MFISFLYLHFVVVSLFVNFLHSHFIFFSTSSLTLPWTIAEFLQSFYTFSPAYCRVVRCTFIFNFSVIFLPQAQRFRVSVFYPLAFFTLCSFIDIFDSTCIYQGFPRSQQFFLEVCRASYWSSKHRPSPSVCLIHSNQQKICPGRFYLTVRAARIREETAPREIRTLSTICLAW